MNNRNFRRIGLAILLLTSICALHAEPQPAFDLERLVAASDLVVIGKVAKLQSLGSAMEQFGTRNVDCVKKSAEIAVLQVLSIRSGIESNSVGASVTVAFLAPESFPVHAERLYGEEVAVLFLKRTGDGIYNFANVKSSKIHLALFDESIDHTTNGLKNRITQQVINSLGSPNVDEVMKASFWLRELHCAVPEREIRLMQESGNTRIRLLATAERIRQGDPKAIANALHELSTSTNQDRYEADAIASALSASVGRITVGSLNELAAAGPPHAKRLGTSLLIAKGDESSLPFLVQNLDSTNREIQYDSILAMARIAGKVAPMQKDFAERPEHFAEEWKAWWKKSVSH